MVFRSTGNAVRAQNSSATSSQLQQSVSFMERTQILSFSYSNYVQTAPVCFSCGALLLILIFTFINN